MKINFHKLYMAIIDLEVAAKAARTYSEANCGYMVDTEDIQEPLDSLLKILNEETNKCKSA